MFRTLIYPSSGAYDYSVELPHWSYCSWFDVCWSFGVVGLEWYPCCRIQPATRIPLQPNQKLLMMDILMSETCWAHKKWNKIAIDIKLVFCSSTITMMHGPINIIIWKNKLKLFLVKWILCHFINWSQRYLTFLRHVSFQWDSVTEFPSNYNFISVSVIKTKCLPV